MAIGFLRSPQLHLWPRRSRGAEVLQQPLPAAVRADGCRAGAASGRPRPVLADPAEAARRGGVAGADASGGQEVPGTAGDVGEEGWNFIGTLRILLPRVV